MKVMVKEAKKVLSDVEYPENTKQGNDGSAQIRLPQELFGKYKGMPFFASITQFKTSMVTALKIDCSVKHLGLPIRYVRSSASKQQNHWSRILIDCEIYTFISWCGH